MPARAGSGLPATLRAVLAVTVQGAVLLLAMVLLFVPFSYAPGGLGLTAGYLTYPAYPVLLVLLLALGHRWFNHLPIARLGFSWRSLPSGLLAGCGIGSALVLGVVALTAAWHPAVSLRASAQEFSPTSAVILLADAWETGFTEELLVRGYLLPALLRRGMGPHASVVWSVFLFTLAHFLVRPLWWLVLVAVSGLVLSYLYYATASIWVPVAVHIVANLLYGLIGDDLVLSAPGLAENLAALAVTQCAVYLALTALLIVWHRRRLESGASRFPLPSILEG